ncbi:MAG: hypothetical protein GC154_09080 [bacterium]|nr:hypothetical protein [bacterium]
MSSSSKRFLRDNTLAEMLDEIRNISSKVSDSEFPTMMFTKSLSSISELYEVNIHVLRRLESAIEQIRDIPDTKDVLEDIVDAAAHVQIGLVSVHTSLKADIVTLMDSLQNLKNTFTDDEEEPSAANN